MEKTYAGIIQRWLVVESQKRRELRFKTSGKKMKKEEVEAQKNSGN
ncbi:MAG: hypothetical protein MGG11_05405 [Trichodesmium sp. MAG_R03]|nr:hypothetical protein [Trichodesmium sp. MAG_R03]